MGAKERHTLIIALSVIFIGGMICVGIYTSYVPLLKQYGNPLGNFDHKSISEPFKNIQTSLKIFNGT